MEKELKEYDMRRREGAGKKEKPAKLAAFLLRTRNLS